MPGAALVDEDGTQLSPSLSLASTVAVPALNIPASNVKVLVAGGDGAVKSDIEIQVRCAVLCCCLHMGASCESLCVCCLPGSHTHMAPSCDVDGQTGVSHACTSTLYALAT